MEENYPSGPENIQFSQRAERINVVRSGKVIFRKFGNEAQTTEGNFGCGDLTIKISAPNGDVTEPT